MLIITTLAKGFVGIEIRRHSIPYS